MTGEGDEMSIFAIIRRRTDAWDFSRPMEEQPGWRGHADFMDALYEEGLFALVGPLEGSRDVLLIVRARDAAEIERRLAADPWSGGMLETVRIAPWTLRLGALC
jgi:uncharacterized protein YciI